MIGRRILFVANQEGYLSLAGLCAVLAQPGVPDAQHIHLDRYRPLEDNSIGGFVLCRLESSNAGGEYIVAGGLCPSGEFGGFVPGSFAEGWTRYNSSAGLNVMNACIGYSLWDDLGKSPYDALIATGATIILSEDTFSIGGDTSGLIALASAFVTMAQPSTKEGATLTVGIPEYRHPESICDMELKLVSDWPQWGITRSNGPWPEFEDAAVQG